MAQHKYAELAELLREGIRTGKYPAGQRLPSENELTASTGYSRQTVRQAIIVELRSADGSGWGECVAGDSPSYSYETTDSAWSILSQWLAPAVMARPLSTLTDLHERWAWVRGHAMARAAIEQAAAALLAAEKGQSLAAFIGGTRAAVPVATAGGSVDLF